MKKLSVFLTSLLFWGISIAQAQTVRITGTVTSSEDGMPLPGVSVFVKGTTVGTATNVDGNYELNVPTNAQTLTFSSVGFDVVEFAIAGRSIIDVVLKPSAIQVQEVVVTALGIKRNPIEMGVATVKVSSDELTNAGASNVMNALSAKVSGLQINTINNGVNPSTKITLRGNRHFLASNQALVVIDGVPVNANYLTSINPNDIEGVNVLKGASASALYGNEASNGVVIVTTKKGAKQKPTINVSNVTNFESISYLPNLQTRFGSGSGETPDNSDPNYTFWIGPDRNTDPYTSYENQQYGPEYNGQMVILGGKLVDGSYQMVPYKAIKNQKKDFFDVGVTNQFDISYSAGNDDSNIYISGQNVTSTGTVPEDKNRRSGVRFAAGKKFNKFGADFTVGLTNSHTDVSGGDMYQDRGVYWNVLNTPAHVPLTQYKNINSKFGDLDGYFNAYYPNPYWQINHSRQITDRNYAMSALTLSYKLFDWMEISDRAGVVYQSIDYSYHKDAAVYTEYSQSDPWSQGHMGVSSPYAADAGNSMQNNLTLTNDVFLKVDKNFGDISAKIIGGSSLYATKTNYNSMSASALVIPELYNISNRIGEAVVDQSNIERRSLGVFGDVTFGYKEWMFLHVSARNDWDSRLTKENRSFFYPGADLSLILSNMIPQVTDNGVINFLKVRGSWSKTGQISISNWYATLPIYVASTGFPYGNTAGFRLSTTLSNPNLKPEITNEIEAGLEISLFNSRINLTTNVFKSNTKDQTIPASLSAATGYYSAFINAGELETKGIENDLRFTPINNTSLGLKWAVTINYSYMTNKVISVFPGLKELAVNDGVNTSASYAVVGEQFPAIKVSDVLRDPQGRIIVDPETGLPKKNPELVLAGHGNPNHILGIVNEVSFKGFTLNVVAEYRTGNVILNRVGNALDFTGTSEHSALNGRQPFVIPNSVIDNGDGTYTPNTNITVQNASRSFWVNSDYHTTDRAYVTSAAFWKLRELSLTYSIPVNKIFGDKVIKSADISVVGRNLLMYRPDTNVWTDPEFNNSDVNSNAVGYTTEDQTPPTRIFGFSVKLTF